MHKKNELNAQEIELFNKKLKKAGAENIQREKLLEEKLKKNISNIETLLELALLELTIPFYDEDKSIEYLEKILEIKKNHPIALLILADVQVRRFGNIDEKLKDKLSTLVTNSPEINSMFRFAASEFYRYHYHNDPIMQEKFLKESINFYQGHVWNYVRLADIYFEKEQKLEAKELIRKALKNVQEIYILETWKYNPTDVNEFLYAFFNGVHLLSDVYKSIKKKLTN